MPGIRKIDDAGMYRNIKKIMQKRLGEIRAFNYVETLSKDKTNSLVLHFESKIMLRQIGSLG